MKSLCVFCGSSPGINHHYTEAAVQLGKVLAEKKIHLVYGGAKVGTMGLIAKSVLESGGQVTGVIPKALKDREVAFTELENLHVVGSMHERKALMAELSDGFIAMPGGLGTFEEFFEVLTWAQLGIHQKPCGLLNVNNYYHKLIDFLDHSIQQEFIKTKHSSLFITDNDPLSLIEQFKAWTPEFSPFIDKAEWALNATVPIPECI